MKLPLSVAIIAYNEEARIGRTLKSVEKLAQEIIVLDSGSTDQTPTIVKEQGATLFYQPWLGYRDQKNKALEKCNFPWVLSLDADEELSLELQEEIILFFSKGLDQKFQGGSFKRKTEFLGRFITHGEWYPDRQLRLFKKELAHWENPIHEKIVLQGKTFFFKNDLLHYSFPTMKSFLDKISLFSEAFYQNNSQKKWSLWEALSHSLWRFFKGYFLKRGFLDGFPGFWIAYATAFSTFVKYSSLYKNQNKH